MENKIMTQEELNKLSFKILPYIVSDLLKRKYEEDEKAVLKILAQKAEITDENQIEMFLSHFSGTKGKAVDIEALEIISFRLAEQGIRTIVELQGYSKDKKAQAIKFHLLLASTRSHLFGVEAHVLLLSMFGQHYEHIRLIDDYENPYSNNFHGNSVYFKSRNTGGQACFVATVCDTDETVLTQLRSWRDKQNSGIGKSFVDFYYTGFGYSASRIIHRFPFLKVPSRTLIRLFIFLFV